MKEKAMNFLRCMWDEFTNIYMVLGVIWIILCIVTWHPILALVSVFALRCYRRYRDNPMKYTVPMDDDE
jgi:hypothetical protein